jgi:hypothetical protein
MAACRTKNAASTGNPFESGTDYNCYPLAADVKRLPEHLVARRLAPLWSLLFMKQLYLFEGPTTPKRKLTRKRIEREAAKSAAWGSLGDSFHIRPKLPSQGFFRTLVKRGLMTFDERVKLKPLPRAKSKRSFTHRPAVQIEAVALETVVGFVDNALSSFDVNGLLHVGAFEDRRDWSNPRRPRLTDALGQRQPTDDRRHGRSRRRSASPLYLAYPILDRRWQRRRSAERRSGQDRRKG